MNKKVMVGMSGGVDSAVAALLLKRQGYDVAGVTFRLWDGGSPDAVDAKTVCDALEIPHTILGLEGRFREKVMDYFTAAYRRGETPNPCVACNKHIKFGAFFEYAGKCGYDFIATGHYASVIFDEAACRMRLKKSPNIKKDQSYVLYNLSRERLENVLLPLGGLMKEEVRTLAAEAGLPVHHKAESQDICFIPDGDYTAFLERQGVGGFEPGCFIGPDGNVIGTHKGICRYTIGQRKGLGVSFGKPLFVAGIDPAANTVMLAEDCALLKRELTVSQVNWIEAPGEADILRYDVKIRYSHRPEPAAITFLPGGDVRIIFDEPQRAITPGQAAVIYDGEFVAGGGIILSDIA